MSDYLHRFLKWLDYNRYTAVAAIMLLAILVPVITITGCQVTTESIITEGKMVSEAELEQEIAIETATLAAQVERARADIARQRELQQAIMDIVSTVATQTATGTLNPVALLPAGIGLLGLFYGAGKKADNKRKDKVIAATKSAAVAVKPT